MLRFQAIQRSAYHTVAADGFANEVWVFGCDVGTHVDSPAHFFVDGRTISDLKLEE